MAKKTDDIERDKRLRVIQEWLIDGWPAIDIKTEIVNRYGVSIRQAERYISKARERWNKDEDIRVDRKRRKTIDYLKKQQRSLKKEFIGTPSGMNVLLRIEREIIKLEGLCSKEKENPENTKPNIETTNLPDISTADLIKYLENKSGS